uniref:Uncharacterized protein n=1 Tax=Caudovirales sp. ct7oE3 TaxID=2826768 RepID=A0A8S5LZX6_9CAUD|nr:MAG TPA: hypothetical protein [Caudovirales sp. ct7oE3]
MGLIVVDLSYFALEYYIKDTRNNFFQGFYLYYIKCIK